MLWASPRPVSSRWRTRRICHGRCALSTSVRFILSVSMLRTRRERAARACGFFQHRCKASDACLARGSWISCGHLRIEQSGTIDGHSGLNMSSSEPTMGNLRRGRCRARSRATLTTTRGIRRLTICISGSCARDRSAVVYEPRVVSGATSSMTMPSVQRLSSNSRLSQTNFGRSRWPTSVCALQVAVDVRRCHASR